MILKKEKLILKNIGYMTGLSNEMIGCKTVTKVLFGVLNIGGRSSYG